MQLENALENRKQIILDLGLNESSWSGLKSYLNGLWSANEELNLISRKMTPDELIDNHVIDCLLPLKHFPKNLKKAADFGSGGGLPGVIYALQFPQTKYLLFEKSKLKQDFLSKCKEFAPNLEVHGDIPPTLEQVEIVTARAFKPIDVILEVSRSYYNKGGKYFLLKARKEKIDEELLDARKKFKTLKVDVISLKSPVLDVERHLVRI